MFKNNQKRFLKLTNFTHNHSKSPNKRLTVSLSSSSLDQQVPKIKNLMVNKISIEPIQVFSKLKRINNQSSNITPSDIQCFSLQRSNSQKYEYGLDYLQLSNSAQMGNGAYKPKLKELIDQPLNINQIEFYKALTRSKSDPQYELQIRQDTIRTFGEEGEQQQIKMLENILINYSKYDHEVGYVQGMNMLIGSVLKHTRSEVQTFSIMKSLMNQYKYRELYIHQFKILHNHCYKLFYVHLKNLCFDIYSHLSKYNIEPIMFMPPWFLTMLAIVVDFDYMHIIVSKFMTSGFDFLYRMILCFMVYLKQEIFEAGEAAVVVLGSSHSRRKIINWPQIILASDNIKL